MSLLASYETQNKKIGSKEMKVQEAARNVTNVSSTISNRPIKKVIFVKDKLVNFVV